MVIPDEATAKGVIRHSTSVHFFKMIIDDVDPEKIIVTIDKIKKIK